MKTADLPHSENVEDRRGEPPAKPAITINEALALAKHRVRLPMAERITPEPTSPLARMAGVDDVQP
jgi:hypothetical protein